MRKLVPPEALCLYLCGCWKCLMSLILEMAFAILHSVYIYQFMCFPGNRTHYLAVICTVLYQLGCSCRERFDLVRCSTWHCTPLCVLKPQHFLFSMFECYFALYLRALSCSFWGYRLRFMLLKKSQEALRIAQGTLFYTLWLFPKLVWSYILKVWFTACMYAF